MLFRSRCTDGDRTWKIDAVRLDATLREPDLAVTYESTGVTDPAAVRTEADRGAERVAEGPARLAAELSRPVGHRCKGRQAHPVIELPMGQIP